ncbi:MAG: acyl-CoA dehydrogenase family protein [Xanthomonadaceae bacterium]|nr:acyl-CoA dehydrogenase family protein [Xanthomonadaceae bacterium]
MSMSTHRVENQPPPFEPDDFWRNDAVLRAAVAREGAAQWQGELSAYGALAGNALFQLGFDANRDKPRLKTHDRFGHRVNQVEFHPAYHQLMQAGVEHGVSALSWRDPRPGSHVARAALIFMHHQAEAGTNCPLTMTHAAVPVLRQAPGLAEWAEKAIAAHYDPRDVPIAGKAGITLGMGMTEKQGGSDVRANSTRAEPLAGEGEYALTGHKWFMSAPMCDGFLVLAQAPGGLSCFLLPRWRPDGERNNFRLMRLKDKLGNWANASSEVEFDAAWASRIGPEGRGVATIIEMVALTRLDCLVGSAAEMRLALAHALHHCRHRRAFGKTLIDHALMANVLADLALESEAATMLAMRVARAVDAAPRDSGEAAFARIATAIGKYWVCKRAPAFVNEAQECLGGAGYVEESILPRLYREAPLNSLWEGCGNIQCLDVLRSLAREPETGRAMLAELALAQGKDAIYDRELADLRSVLTSGENLEPVARRLVERLALAVQAGLMLRHAPEPVAQAFLASRLAGDHGLAFGTLPAKADVAGILVRVGSG